jgi:predicted RNA-binding protein with PIN domain
VYGSSSAAAEHLVRVPGVVVLVDGYNVAKLAWPALDLDHQRDRCISACEDVARRSGTDVAVVFDGSNVVGATAQRRRLVRVRFSPEGVTADDVLRDEVAGLRADVPVVVVTNDQAVVADVRSHGANVLTSQQWLELAGR